MKLYIANFPFKIEEDDLRLIFEHYGAVSQVIILKHRDTKKSRGVGFVYMDNKNATLAMREMHGKEYWGRGLVVREALDKNAF